MKNSKILGITLLMTAGIYISLTLNGDPLRRGPGECLCPHVWAPVCIIETGQQFPNACEAECAGFTSDEYVDCFAQ